MHVPRQRLQQRGRSFRREAQRDRVKFSHYSDKDARSFPHALQQQMIAQIQGALQSYMLTAQVGEKVGLLTAWETFTLVQTQTPGQYYLKSVAWGSYLTLYPQGATEPNGVGMAGWSPTQTQEALLSIQSTGDGRYTIGSVQYPNVYLRMDGTGVTASNGSGVGVANCQITAGPWEKMCIVAP